MCGTLRQVIELILVIVAFIVAWLIAIVVFLLASVLVLMFGKVPLLLWFFHRKKPP